MTLQLSLTAEQERRLRERAAASGQDVSTYVARLVEQFADVPASLDEISGPIQQAFVESGMTEDELSDLLEEAKHEMRAERRSRREQ